MFRLSLPPAAYNPARLEDAVKQILNFLTIEQRELEQINIDYETRIQKLEEEIMKLKGES